MTARRVRRATPLTAVITLCAAAVLAGCQAAAGDDADPIGTLQPGAAPAPANFFGVTYSPCTKIELEGYPVQLAAASRDYYEGPWCARVGEARTYLWAYSRPLTPEQTPESVRGNVVSDAEQMALDLEAQGYRRVCGTLAPGVGVDAGFEKPAEKSRIRVAARGSVAQPPQATSTEPLSLVVVLSPARGDPPVAEGAAAPPC